MVLLVIKILQRIFEIHKKQVFHVVNDLVNELVTLKNNEELFLHKYDINVDQERLITVLSNNNPTTENLAKHKIVLKILMGRLNEEEAKRMKSEEVYSELYNKVSIYITDWEMIAKSTLLIVCIIIRIGSAS